MDLEKVRPEVLKLTEVKKEAFENDEQAFLLEILRKLNDLGDKDWDSMSNDSMDWFNSAGDAYDNSTALPSLGEDKKDDAISTRRRRRVIPETKDPEPAAEVEDSKEEEAALPATTDTSKLTLDTLPIGSKILVITSKDDIEGEVSKVTERTLTLITEEGERNVARIRVKDFDLIEMGTSGAAPAEEEEEEKTETAEPAAEPTKEEEKPAAPQAARSQRRGKGITAAIRTAIAENPKSTRDEILKILQDKDVDVRPSTLDISFSDMHKAMEALTEVGLLKI